MWAYCVMEERKTHYTVMCVWVKESVESGMEEGKGEDGEWDLRCVRPDPPLLALLAGRQETVYLPE